MAQQQVSALTKMAPGQLVSLAPCVERWQLLRSLRMAVSRWQLFMGFSRDFSSLSCRSPSKENLTARKLDSPGARANGQKGNHAFSATQPQKAWFLPVSVHSKEVTGLGPPPKGEVTERWE